MEYPNCRSNLNDADIYGCGNCNLTVKSSDGSRDAFGIWLVDSNDYLRDEKGALRYDCVHPDQIEWFEKRSEELKKANAGKPLPSILFQHMPVQQEYDLLKETDIDGENTATEDGKRYTFDESLISGRFREMPCPPDRNASHREQFESWKKTGGVLAAFFGHDHVNDFHINVDGIDLYQTIGAGFFTYGKEHGGRLIILDENEPESIKTEVLEVERLYSE